MIVARCRERRAKAQGRGLISVIWIVECSSVFICSTLVIEPFFALVLDLRRLEKRDLSAPT